MSASTHEQFSSRFGLLLTALGMAIGTGNIWRFPRIMAKTGGGAFLVTWLIFLFAWSIPLLVLEFGLGRSTRRGCIGAFARTGGRRWGVLGSFVAFTCSAIMFYYAVVAGWCVKYLLLSLTGGLEGLAGDSAEAAFTAFGNSWEPVIYQFGALVLAGAVTLRGVVRGIETANKVLIPTLFVLMLLALVRTLTLPGAGEGLSFVYGVQWADLADANVWLEGLSQSAWSTGAAWGLILTYGVYVRREERIVSNAVITGLGNNVASLVSATAIIPAVFALAPLAIEPARLEAMGGVSGFLQSGGPASTGLTFIWMPALFDRMPGGGIFTPLFFLALFFAALSSLIAMVEMAGRVLMDMGISRRKAVIAVVGVAFLLGLPSATNLAFFGNQDWAWGVGLMVSGLFVALVVIRHGPARFRQHALAADESRLLGRLRFDLWVRYAIPLQFVVVLGWWFHQSVSWNPEGWWNPFGGATIGTCLMQWGLALALFFALNRFLVRRTLGEPAPETDA